MAKATFEQKVIRTISVGLIVGLAAYAVTYEEETDAPPGAVEGAAIIEAIAISDSALAAVPYKGAENPKVVIIESSEFQ